MQWLLIGLLLGAGICKALSDALAHGSPRLGRRGLWWDNSLSWKLKYQDYGRGDLRPRFPGSTTLLVFATDAWHAFNFGQWLCADAAFLLAAWPSFRWYAVGAVAGRRLVFEPLYKALRK